MDNKLSETFHLKLLLSYKQTKRGLKDLKTKDYLKFQVLLEAFTDLRSFNYIKPKNSKEVKIFKLYIKAMI